MGKIEFRPKIRITLMRKQNERFYGPGVQELLRGIRVHGSVKDACEAMDMSYSKGRRILKHAEAALGYKLVERQQGGVDGGHAYLTPAAEDFMARYEMLTDEVDEYARTRLQQIWAVSAPDTDKSTS